MAVRGQRDSSREVKSRAPWPATCLLIWMDGVCHKPNSAYRPMRRWCSALTPVGSPDGAVLSAMPLTSLHQTRLSVGRPQGTAQAVQRGDPEPCAPRSWCLQPPCTSYPVRRSREQIAPSRGRHSGCMHRAVFVPVITLEGRRHGIGIPFSSKMGLIRK